MSFSEWWAQAGLVDAFIALCLLSMLLSAWDCLRWTITAWDGERALKE